MQNIQNLSKESENTKGSKQRSEIHLSQTIIQSLTKVEWQIMKDVHVAK